MHRKDVRVVGVLVQLIPIDEELERRVPCDDRVPWFACVLREYIHMHRKTMIKLTQCTPNGEVVVHRASFVTMGT